MLYLHACEAQNAVRQIAKRGIQTSFLLGFGLGQISSRHTSAALHQDAQESRLALRPIRNCRDRNLRKGLEQHHTSLSDYPRVDLSNKSVPWMFGHSAKRTGQFPEVVFLYGQAALLSGRHPLNTDQWQSSNEAEPLFRSRQPGDYDFLEPGYVWEGDFRMSGIRDTWCQPSSLQN